MRPATRGMLGAASLLLIAYTLYLIIWPLRWRLLLVWLVVEALFFVCVFLPRYDRLNRQPQPHEPAGHDAMRCWRRFLRYCREVPGGMDSCTYIRGWYRGAEPSQVKRGNLEEFVAYGFWYRTIQQMLEAGVGHVPGQMVDQLQQAWGVTFEPGYNPHVSFYAHLWEPLNASWRPLAFYLLMEAVGHGGRALLRRWGFQLRHHSGLAYFTLGLEAQDPEPIVPNSSGHSSSARCSSNNSSSGCDLDSALGERHLALGAAGGGGVLPEHERDGAAPAQQQPLPAAGSADAAAAGGAHSSQAQQQQQHQMFTSILAAVCEAQTHDDLDWTPFASDSSSAQCATIEPTPHSMERAGCRLPGPDSASAAAAAAAAAAVAAAQSGGSSAGRGSSSSWGLKAAAMSAPVPGAGRDHDQARDQGKHAVPAMRAVSALPQCHARSSLANLPQLAPCTSQLLSAGTCPLQQALSMTGLGQAPPGMPVLFLHGVGGLPAYLQLVLQMVAGQHPIIAVEFKGVSMRLGNVSTADEVQAAVVGMMDNMGVDRACVMAHSYGTFIASLLLKRHPQRVASLYLLDPVCIGMFMPYLLTNFLYRQFHWAGWSKAALAGYAKVAVRKLAANDLHLCTTFARRFYWTDLNMWPEDLPAGSVVLLSGRDDLLDSRAVQGMLERAGHVQVIFKPELTHGAFLLVPEVKAAIMQQLKALLTSSGSAVAGLAGELSSLFMNSTLMPIRPALSAAATAHSSAPPAGG